MATTIPERSQLGASTTNRKYYLDVVDPDASGSEDIWIGVFGLQEGKPRPSEATTQDDSDFDGEGYKSQAVTALTWGFDGKVLRKIDGTDSTAYDPGQEVLRKVAAKIGGRVKFRYYEMEPDGPRVEAMTGWGTVTWAPDGGNMESLDSVAFTITGRGKPTSTVHPAAESAVPVIVSADPSGAAAGDTVAIRGGYFTGITGVSGVKFGADNAASYQVLADDLILAVVPAGVAGSAPIKVGASAEFPYTRGA